MCFERSIRLAEAKKTLDFPSWAMKERRKHWWRLGRPDEAKRVLDDALRRPDHSRNAGMRRNC